MGCRIKFEDEILSYRLPPQATIYGLKGSDNSAAMYAWATFAGLDVEFLDLGEDYDLVELMESFPCAEMVPQIMVDGLDVGNLEEFKEWLKYTIG